mgnify:CR=1 FL=1
MKIVQITHLLKYLIDSHFSFDNLNQTDFKNYIYVENFFKKFDINLNKIPKVNISRNDPACIIYTSGTQGNPKGVILSHGGILNNCEGAYELLQPLLSQQTRFLTWLPLSHSYEHTVQFVQISVGAKIFYAEGIDKLINYLTPAEYLNSLKKPRGNFTNLFDCESFQFETATNTKICIGSAALRRNFTLNFRNN